MHEFELLVREVEGWLDVLGRLRGDLRNAADEPFITAGYAPANPGQWADPAPATLAESNDRLAAAYYALTGNPVP